jgi:hypothetical protein
LTFQPANYRLPGSGDLFNVMQNIKLTGKDKENLIPKHLSKVETFNAMSILLPYRVTLAIDRNRISKAE